MAAQAGFEPALPKHGLTVRCITYLPLSIEMIYPTLFDIPLHIFSIALLMLQQSVDILFFYKFSNRAVFTIYVLVE